MEYRFDVEGYVAGYGNPAWLLSHEPATRTAQAVKALLEAGATCVGKLHMDELGFRYTILSPFFAFTAEIQVHFEVGHERPGILNLE